VVGRGSLVSRQEDLQSTTLPAQMVLFVPYFVAAFGSEEVRTVMSMLRIVKPDSSESASAAGLLPAVPRPLVLAPLGNCGRSRRRATVGEQGRTTRTDRVTEPPPGSPPTRRRTRG
jgi:hypothetical protein